MSAGSNYRFSGFRWAETLVGDSVQRVAERELGDAGRWPEIAALNALDPPYMIDGLSGLENQEVAATAARVLLSGQRVKIPASPRPAAVSDPTDIYGTDLALLPGDDGPRAGGLLEADPETGDFLLVTDLSNLSQALRHRVATHEKELVRHPSYGNPLHRLVGQGAGPAQKLLAQAQAERMLRSDPRVADLAALQTDVEADAIGVEAVVVATDGRSLPIGQGDE